MSSSLLWSPVQLHCLIRLSDPILNNSRCERYENHVERFSAVKGARLFNRLKSYGEARKMLVKWLKYFPAPFQIEIPYLEQL